MRSKCLKIEPLEDRRMLAAFSVSNLNDSGTGSLRAAIGQANTAAGADTISFAANLSGGTINLTGGELVINEALTIDARPLAANITINANQLSRIINITPNVGDFSFGGLKLTGGKTTAAGSAGFGAAIRSNTRADLTLSECQIVGNTVTGANSGGAGIFSRSILTLVDSSVENNSTTGTRSGGGGIYSLVGTVTIARSVIRGNSTAGDEASGGGIWAEDILNISDSTIAGNSTTGDEAVGGGIAATSQVTVNQSTISGNTTSGTDAYGGGIFSSVTVTVTRSTITNNRVLGAGAFGAGIFIFNDGPLTLDHSILAGNRRSSSESNFLGLIQDLAVVDFSLIGTDVTVGTGANNIVNNNPLLGPLANNGGPTMTHALLPGSPGINAGNPAVAFAPGVFDQRGTGFARVASGRIDIGALESQSSTIPTADYDNDGDVDGRDFLRWQRGGSPAPLSSGDLNLWQGQYGTGGLSAISIQLSAVTGTAESSDLPGAVAFFSTSTGEYTSEIATATANEYSGEVDQAFAELGNVPRGTNREFGEIAVRRKAPSRVPVSVEFASQI